MSKNLDVVRSACAYAGRGEMLMAAAGGLAEIGLEE
jgi:hypothetical protein